jgi:hypothetical protein
MLTNMAMVLIGFFVIFHGYQGIALPKTKSLVPPRPAASYLQPSSDSYDFQSIVALPNCSGSLVRFVQSQADDKALVLTNGHCVKIMGNDEVLVDLPESRIFRLLDQLGRSLGTIITQRLIYATMKDTDLALYELEATFDEIFGQFGIKPLVLAQQVPPLGTAIEIISGYWQRGYSCSIEAIVPQLIEGRWQFAEALRYSRPGCAVIGGTSGSPVIARDSREVIAVNNTINERGRRCAVNNPCEVAADGTVRYERGFGYAQQTVWLYQCLTAAREFDLYAPNCRLPRPAT